MRHGPRHRNAIRWVVAATGVTALALCGFQPAAAEFYAGGFGPHDCLATFDAPVNQPTAEPRRVVCTDGDPTCDGDATVDGACRVAVTVCGNSTHDPRCVPAVLASITVEHARDDGSPRFDTDFQALQARIDTALVPPTAATDVCASPATITVRIRGPNGLGVCRKGTKRIGLEAVAQLPDRRRDRDLLWIDCVPASCDPVVLFTDTFDRLQTQVFDASCAVSGCHDSQSLRGGLTLERGTSYGALVGVAPQNGAALADGWLRVTPGDPATSLLRAKLTRPPAGFGARMPFGRPPLSPHLVRILEAWIAAGAPAAGWVPGTD